MEKLSSKIKKYEKLILEILGEMQHISPNHLLIIDKVKRHYQVIYAGLDAREVYSYRVRVHFHIREDGKICLLENATEIDFLDIFLPKGIPKSDLLPQFIPINIRQIAGYAV